jgi:hypothetical protein
MQRIFLVFITFLHFGVAWAQAPQNSLSKAVNVSVGNSKGSTNFRTEGRAWTDSFISPDYEATSGKTFSYLGGKLYNINEKEALFKMDVQGGFAFNAPLLSYINVSQLYFDIPFEVEGQPKPNALAIGRKKSEWSEVDSRWNLGIWEPVFKYNPLNPERQGLLGLFLNLPGENVDLELMGSPFYLPDQGPSFAVNEEGEFEKGNPWFQRPADSIKILSETSKVQYNLEKPNETEVVTQTVYAGRLRAKLGGLSLQGSYAYKPMNQLPLAYTGTLNISKDRGVVDIKTSVQYHELMGADLKYENDIVTVGVSTLHDRPYREATFKNAEDWNRPTFSEANLISPYIDLKFAKGWLLKIQHIDIAGGEVTEVGPLATPNRAPITKRYPYQQAEDVEIGYQGKALIQRPWRTSVNYMFSQKNKFDLLKWRGQILLTKKWEVFTEALMVKADSENLERPSDFVEFQNHDRVLAGVGYVF